MKLNFGDELQDSIRRWKLVDALSGLLEMSHEDLTYKLMVCPPLKLALLETKLEGIREKLKGVLND